MNTDRLRIGSLWDTLVKWAWRVVPILGVVAVSAYVLGGQIVRPHHRVIKAMVMSLVLVILLKFDMIYSLYFFIMVFPFPTGITGVSSNVIVITMVALLWVFRANTSGQRVFERTDVDWPMLALLMAYIVSIFNAESAKWVAEGWEVIWRHLTAMGLFYLIVTAASTEKRLERLTKVWCVSSSLLFLTAVMELFMPNTVIIPGWIEFGRVETQTRLGYRIEGIRVGGSTGSQVLMADLSSMMLLMMAFYFVYVKPKLEKVAWFALFVLALVTLLATANRGATLSLMLGIVYAGFVFRRRLNLVRYALVIAVLLAVGLTAEAILKEHTLAVSVVDRIVGTEVAVGVPKARQNSWIPAFTKCFEHIFIGHGPYYGLYKGLNRLQWPHNAYVYYLYTVGLFGLTAFLVIVYKLMRNTLMYSRRAVRGKFLGMIMGVMHIQLIMLLIEQMRTDHQRDLEFIYIYEVWILFALIISAGRLIKAEEARVRAQRAAAEPPPALDGAPEPAQPRV